MEEKKKITSRNHDISVAVNLCQQRVYNLVGKSEASSSLPSLPGRSPGCGSAVPPQGWQRSARFALPGGASTSKAPREPQLSNPGV